MSSCAILGASGHGKVIAEIAELIGHTNIVFFDDTWPKKKNIERWLVAGDSRVLNRNARKYDVVAVAIGDNLVRFEKHKQLQSSGAKLKPLIHPESTVSVYARLGSGTVIMAGAVVNPFVNIGQACIINTAATVDHDCKLADGVHISPGAHLAGGVNVGECSWIGIGSRVIPIIDIGRNVVVGAGSTVINDIPNYQTVVGSPAHTLIKSVK